MATQPARDVLGTSPEGPLKVLTSGTSMGPLGDSQGTNKKIDDLTKKVFFRCNSLCFTRLLLIFTGKRNIQNFEMGTSTGRLRDPVAGRPGDQIMGRFDDVGGTSVIYFFKIQLRNILNLYWQVTQDFIVNCGREKFSKQYSN